MLVDLIVQIVKFNLKVIHMKLKVKLTLGLLFCFSFFFLASLFAWYFDSHAHSSHNDVFIYLKDPPPPLNNRFLFYHCPSASSNRRKLQLNAKTFQSGLQCINNLFMKVPKRATKCSDCSKWIKRSKMSEFLSFSKILIKNSLFSSFISTGTKRVLRMHQCRNHEIDFYKIVRINSNGSLLFMHVLRNSWKNDEGKRKIIK